MRTPTLKGQVFLGGGGRSRQGARGAALGTCPGDQHGALSASPPEPPGWGSARRAGWQRGNQRQKHSCGRRICASVSTTQGFRNLIQSNGWEFLMQCLEDSPEKASSRRNCGEQTVNILSKFPQFQLSPVDFSPKDVSEINSGLRTAANTKVPSPYPYGAGGP